MRSLGRALDAAHEHGIAHLSLKPTNLFVGPAPAYNVRLVDFAMSLVHGALSSPEKRRASAPWLAPEQQDGGTGGGPAADIFATALLGFYALTGASYWRWCYADSLDESAWQSELLGSRAPVSERAREIGIALDVAFDAPFARALAVSPDERFRTAGDFAEALAAALEASADAMGKPATVSEAPAPAFAANLIAADVEQPGPTSTSAVILAPSSPPDSDGSSSEAFAAADVPPPPAQMGAVLAAYETAAPHRFPMESSARLSTDTEAGVVPVRPRFDQSRCQEMVATSLDRRGCRGSAGCCRHRGSDCTPQEPFRVGSCTGGQLARAITHRRLRSSCRPGGHASSGRRSHPVDDIAGPCRAPGAGHECQTSIQSCSLRCAAARCGLIRAAQTVWEIVEAMQVAAHRQSRCTNQRIGRIE